MSPRKLAERLTSLEIHGLVLAGFALLVFRFLNPGLAPFILDEPELQSLLDQAFQERSFPLLGLRGSYSLRYGPTALWFYLPARFITSEPRFLILWHALAFSGAFLLGAAAVRRTYGVRAAAWFLLLAAASPLLFFYSRLAWDNTLLTLWSSCMLAILASLPTRPTVERFAGLGLAGALAINTHPVGLPLVCAALLMALPQTWHAGRSELLPRLAALLLPLLSLPGIYAAALLKETGSLLPPRAPGGEALASLAGTVAGLFQFLSPAPFFYVLDRSAPGPLAWLHTAVAALAGAALVLFLYRRRWRSQDPLARFALLSGALGIGFFMLVRPAPLHPHYFTPFWWVTIMAVSTVLAEAAFPFRLIAAALVLVNSAFLVHTQSLLDSTNGTRGPHYGTAIRELARATREICASSGPRGSVVELRKLSGVFPASISYFARHETACRGAKLSLRSWAVAEEPGPPSITVGYSAESLTDASLRVGAGD